MSTSPPAGSADSPSKDVVAVGRIGKAHGLRGAVYVEPWTDAPEERFVPHTVLQTDPPERGPLTIEDVRLLSGKQVIQFAGVADRNTAETLRGTLLVMPAEQRPLIEDPDEFYDTDLIGLSVRSLDGTVFGPVTDVLHSPADSLLVIDLAGREVLLPFRKQFVPDVDLAAGIVVIDPPDGLFDL
jgi:16S rRNA processing protein RimM